MSSEKPKIVNESLFRSSEWDDYPMKRDDKHTNKIIEPDFMPLADSSKPDALPNGYIFGQFTFDNNDNVIKLCAFLNACSVSVSVSHLKWVLIPGSIVVTVNVSTSDKIVGCVCARPVVYRVDGRVISTFEVGWLCTLKELRGKRLASMLMKELYRRVYLLQRDCGIIFATSRQLPSLPLVNGVSLLKRTLTQAATTGGPNGAIEATKNLDLIRFANMRDVSRMMKIYRSYAVETKKWRLYREYTRREFEHVFLRRSDVTTYVIRTDRGDVKDFISLTTTESTANDTGSGSGSGSGVGNTKTGHIHFVSFVNDKLLELFLQNVLHILSKNGYSAVYIEDVNGVSDVCRSKLGFECVQTKWYYQFNYNTRTIPLDQSQFITNF